MKLFCSKRKQIACVCLQILLILMCVTSILAMDLWNLTPLAYDVPSDAIPTSSDTVSHDTMPTPVPEGTDEIHQDPPISVENSDDHIAVSKPQSPLVGEGDTLQNRVQSLLYHTDAVVDGAIDYARLYQQKAVWDVSDIYLGYDELAYLFLQVFVATTPKAKTCYYRQSTVEDVTPSLVRLCVDVEFVFTNKLLALLYGSNSQHLTLALAVKLDAGQCRLAQLDVSGDKRINANLLALGSDALFGTTDYRAHVDKLLSTTVSHLGTVVAMESGGLRLATSTA